MESDFPHAGSAAGFDGHVLSALVPIDPRARRELPPRCAASA